ncbi:DUF3322 domain-containing protein [Alkalilimnicola sp. S0819]|uniref:DUF3322 domain-containing protein n=1 Tax=Alkalilimnicola sp. S0819 TaxID=2613922 RepID=UPI0012627566|nr:DUF3322 domain-containing protein [Alkalilimnicola sp. S0819]KAB7624109.1 hypothetical protein F3N43_06895 [Alkalilimnicola sp. S0819]MPQ16361.1 hypothetical protein [Alkalilimnicola sp. S0819]
MSWSGPAELRRQVQRLWDSGELLRARLLGEPLFPRALRLKRPNSAEIAEHFTEVRDWIRALQAGERAEGGLGYELQWQQVRHRVHGANHLPVAARVPAEADALALIGRRKDAARFDALAEDTLRRFPMLRDWLARRPLWVLEQADAWSRVLAVLDWFVAHPRPGVYLRQLEVPGVDTKFIEARRKLFTELLDGVLPASAVNRAHSGARGFEARYGLRGKPPLLRFRLLDPALYLHGLSDLAVPAADFARLDLPVQRVFITENEINGLAFPDLPGSLVIFGLGYTVERLAEIGRLRDVEVYYWGDVDTHGFAILDRVRGLLPRTRSLLMDRDTLLAHRLLWGEEPAGQRHRGELDRLTADEQALYRDLCEDRLAERLRLEQERIGYAHLRRALKGVL